MSNPVGQPPNLTHHLGPGGQQADRLLQVQRSKGPQLAPHLNPQRARTPCGRGADQQPVRFTCCVRHKAMLRALRARVRGFRDRVACHLVGITSVFINVVNTFGAGVLWRTYRQRRLAG
jgi:hypothetical protein